MTNAAACVPTATNKDLFPGGITDGQGDPGHPLTPLPLQLPEGLPEASFPEACPFTVCPHFVCGGSVCAGKK